MSKFVADWKHSWKWLSVQIAAVAAIIAAVLTANPTLLLGLIAFIPHGSLRTVTAAAVGVTVFVIPVFARLWKQKDAE